MNTRMLPRLAVFGLALLLIGSITSAFAATNSVPATRLDDDSLAIDANAIKPAACASLNLTNIAYGTGTAANDLVLGTAGGDNLSGDDGDDCLVGGGGDDMLDGKKGNDILLERRAGHRRVQRWTGHGHRPQFLRERSRHSLIAADDFVLSAAVSRRRFSISGSCDSHPGRLCASQTVSGAQVMLYNRWKLHTTRREVFAWLQQVKPILDRVSNSPRSTRCCARLRVTSP
jgi:Ca2+-binding RTX toxin-like protein